MISRQQAYRRALQAYVRAFGHMGGCPAADEWEPGSCNCPAAVLSARRPRDPHWPGLDDDGLREFIEGRDLTEKDQAHGR